MSGGIPSGAVGASVGVLLYSSICFILCLLLVLLLISFDERWTYVTLFSAFTALSTLASICQQLHYATAWAVIKQAQFDKAVLSLTQKGLAFGGAAQIVDVVLFDIQFYCYNVMALNVLFWTIALFTGSWGIRSKWLGDYIEYVPIVSKVFSVVFPGLIVALINIPAVTSSGAGMIAASYIAMFASLSMGSLLLVLILYKYMKTRRLVSGYAKRGRWWASDDRSQRDVGAEYTTDTITTGNTTNSRRSIYDKALVTRFTLGFVIMAVFEVAIIIFTLIQSNNNARIAAAGKPDYSLGGTITDIILFVPGVTASLVAFLIFGTTKSWRQYRDLVVGGCGIRRALIDRKTRSNTPSLNHPPVAQGLEFERLPSLQRRPSQEERLKIKEGESRVRMFAIRDPKDPNPIDDSSSDGGESTLGSLPPTSLVSDQPQSLRTSLGRLRSQSETSTVQFHRPRPAMSRMGSGRHASSSDVGLSPHTEIEDPVIQYEARAWGGINTTREVHVSRETSLNSNPSKGSNRERDRRFVAERLPAPRQRDFLESNSDSSDG